MITFLSSLTILSLSLYIYFYHSQITDKILFRNIKKDLLKKCIKKYIKYSNINNNL